MRRHFGRCDTRRTAAKQCHRFAKSARRIRRRSARTCLTRASAKHCARRGHGSATRWNRQERTVGHSIHPRPGTIGFIACGHKFRKRPVAGPACAHGGCEPPARARAQPFRAPRGRRRSARIPISLHARVGRQLAAYTRAKLPRHGSARADYRRRRRRSVRQMRQSNGTSLPWRPAHSPPCRRGRPQALQIRQAAYPRTRLQLQRAEDVFPVHPSRCRGRRPSIRGKEHARPCRLAASHDNRHPS